MTAPFLVPWWSPFAAIALYTAICRLYQQWPTIVARRTATAGDKPGPRTLATPPANHQGRATSTGGQR